MTYKHIMALANRFIIKLAEEPITKAPAPQQESIVKLSPELRELALRMHENKEPPITSNPVMTGVNAPSPEESEFASKVYRHTINIQDNLAADYSALKTIKYFTTKPKETMFMRHIIMKFSELARAFAYSEPYKFYREIKTFLDETPPENLIFFNKTKEQKISTNREGIQRIYYESYSEVMDYNRDLNLGNKKDSVFSGIKLRGLKQLLDFEYWFEETSY